MNDNISTLISLYDSNRISRGEFIDLLKKLLAKDATQNDSRPSECDIIKSDIFELLNFNVIHEIMEKLDWRWNGSVPTIKELKNTVSKHIDEVYKKLDEESYYFVESGGFRVIGTHENGYKHIEVLFILEQAESGNEYIS